MNDVDRFRFQLLRGEAGADGTLDIVAAADAIDVRITAVGDLRRRIAGEIITSMASL